MGNPGSVEFFIDRATAPETSRTLAYEIQDYHSAYDGASCREVNTTKPMQPDWVDFEPAQGESTAPAKFVCNSCVHQDQCLKDALNRNDSRLVWGGTSAKERKMIVKAYYNELGAGTISPTMSKGEFGVIAREDFVKIPKQDTKRTSYPPREIREAHCVNDASDTFDELESTKYPDLTRDLLATALAACLSCPNTGTTCVSYGVKSESGVTVVDGKIEGRPPKRLVPTKKLIVEKAVEFGMRNTKKKSA